MFKIFTSEEFNKLYNRLDKQLQKEVAKEINQLEENPYSGKPLGYKFFREKKIRNLRLFYLIYEQKVIIFVITISTKKDQQNAIDKIKKLMPHYQEEIRKINL